MPASSGKPESWEYVGKEMAAAGFYTDSGHFFVILKGTVRSTRVVADIGRTDLYEVTNVEQTGLYEVTK